MRRVALLIESDGPGGAESVVFSLANGLRARDIDVRPVILASGEGWLTGKLRDEGFDVSTPALKRPLDPSFAFGLSAWTRREQIALLHAHEFTMGFYAGAAGVFSRVPHLITMHGGVTFAAAARRRRALGWSARRAFAVVGVSDSTCAHLASSLSLSRDAITHVPNGVAVNAGDRARGRKALGVADGERLLLAVGNLYEVKGHRILVEAARRVAERTELPPWKIAIAGRGDQEAALTAQIQAAGLTSRVQLLGLRGDIPDLLAASDGWVMPSLSEGLPMALLEAMFAKRAVVASSVGGIPDLIRPGDTGWLSPAGDPEALADAIAELLSSERRAAQYAERGAELAEQAYGLSRMVDRYVALYEQRLSLVAA